MITRLNNTQIVMNILGYLSGINGIAFGLLAWRIKKNKKIFKIAIISILLSLLIFATL